MGIKIIPKHIVMPNEKPKSPGTIADEQSKEAQLKMVRQENKSAKLDFNG